MFIQTLESYQFLPLLVKSQISYYAGVLDQIRTVLNVGMVVKKSQEKNLKASF